MKYNVEEIESRLRAGENSGWEFKQVEFAGDRPKRPTCNDWADEIAAFANAAGGVVLAGVADDSSVIGMSRAQIVYLDSLLVEVSTDTIKPPVRISTHHMELSGDKLVLLVEVPKSDLVHESPGGGYIRVGASKRIMAGEERLRLAQRRSQARFLWFDKQPVPETGFRSLAEALWKPLLSAEGAAEPVAALGKLALLQDDEEGVLRATVAGVLLCTPNPERWLPNACITATRYRGGDRASGQIDAQVIIGPLNKQIADAVAFAARNMQVAARKVPARSDLPQYSERALFEALVNAVVHRDYSIRGSKIRLSMFDDRLEIQSPGSLPNNLTVESMASRQSTRNEALTSVLARMPVAGTRGGEDRRYYMERRGDGVRIVQRETWELCGKYPEYKVVGDSEVLLVIPAATQEQSPARAIVSVRSGGQALPGADLLVLFPNKPQTIMPSVFVQAPPAMKFRQFSRQTMYLPVQTLTGFKSITRRPLLQLQAKRLHVWPGGPRQPRAAAVNLTARPRGDATRKVPCATFGLPERAAVVLLVFREEMARRGIPGRLYANQNACFRSQRLALACAKPGTKLIHARAYHAPEKRFRRNFTPATRR